MSCVLSVLMFKFLTNYELIFVYSVRLLFEVYSFACGCSGFPISFVEETKFYSLHILGSFYINQLTIYVWVYFWGFYPIPWINVSVFMPISFYFDYYSFEILLEIRKHYAFSTVILSQDSFSDFIPLVISFKF